MNEIHRICQGGAVVRITTPHFSSANSFTDPTHRYYFGYFSFHYFTREHDFDFYTGKRFRRRHAQIIFHPTLVNKLIWRLANRYPQAYEQRWAWRFSRLAFERRSRSNKVARSGRLMRLIRYRRPYDANARTIARAASCDTGPAVHT